MRWSLRWWAVAMLLPLFAGCTSSQTSLSPGADQAGAASSEKLDVITTFLPMYIFTKAVAGDTANVEILIEPGTEIHEYQSTPADVQAIARADVVVENGLGLEEFLNSTIESAQNSSLTLINASEGIEPVGELSPVVYPTEGEAGHGHGDESHAEGEAHEEHAGEEHAKAEATQASGAHVHAENPHVWLDPMLAIQQVENIRDGLVAADPQNEATYTANAAAYVQQLEELDRQFRERLQPFSDRTFVTFHDAFPYLATRYDLQQTAIVAIPEDSLSPDDIQRTIGIVKEFDVKALFSEPGVDNKLLQSLSQDLNLQLKTLDSLEAGELDPQYYFTAMEQNLKTLEDAFK